MRGLQGFAEMVRVLIHETNPTSPTRRKIVLATVNMTMKKEELEQQLAIAQREYNDQARGEMTDEELDESIVEAVVPILRRRPQLAARVLDAVAAGSSLRAWAELRPSQLRADPEPRAEVLGAMEEWVAV